MPQELLEHQEIREVEHLPEFNGAQCFICINLNQIASATFQRGEVGITMGELEDRVLDQIDQKISDCPEGATVKIQFIYHYSGHRLPTQPGSGKKRKWDQKRSLANVLNELAKRDGDTRIRKIYLAACHSDQHTQVVDRAFAIDGVTHVVTVRDTIALACGRITGLSWDGDAKQPSFFPQGVKLTIWSEDEDEDKQVGHVSPDNEDVGPDQKFDIRSNNIVNKDAPPCGVKNPISGNIEQEMGYYSTAQQARAVVRPTLDAFARIDAVRAAQQFNCSNPDCPHPGLVVDSVSYTATRFRAKVSFWRRMRNFLPFTKNRPVYYIDFEISWTADVVCN